MYKTIKMKRKLLPVISCEIQSHITVNLHTQKVGSAISQFKTLKQCCEIAEQLGILIDEDNPECIAGQRLAIAENVVQNIQEVKDND